MHIAVLMIVIATTLYAYVLAIFSRTVKLLPPSVSDDLLYIFMVPALNEEVVIHHTLTTLLALRGNFVVLILDDASDDKTAEIVKTFQGDPRALLLERPRAEARTGKGAVLNAGLREIERLGLADRYGAENVIITVFDADARVEPDFLEGLTPYFQDPKVAGVQSAVRMYNHDTNILTFWQHLEFVLWGELFCRAKNVLKSATLGGNGQCVRLAALASLGANPWQSSSLTEDLDLSLRLLSHGWQIRFCPSVAVWQEALPGLRRLIRQRSRWVQGHMVCWRYVPGLLRGSLPLYTKLDLLVFMLMPAALPPVGLVSIFSWQQLLGGIGHTHILSLLGVYVLGFNIAPLGIIAWRRAERPSLPRAIFHSHLFFFNSFVWLGACCVAIWNILKGRRGWAKTSRVGLPSAQSSAGIRNLRIALSRRPAIGLLIGLLALLWLVMPVLSYMSIGGRGEGALSTQIASIQSENVQRARSRLASPIPVVPQVINKPADDQSSSNPNPLTAAVNPTVPSNQDRASFALFQKRTIESTASVRSGEIEAKVAYDDGATTTVVVRFNMGDEQHPSSIQIVASYRDAILSESVEEITVGNDTWRRQNGGSWVIAPAAKSVKDKLLPYLPKVDSVKDPQLDILGDIAVLRWFDADHEIDETLRLNGPLGTPEEMRRVERTSGEVMTLAYRAWNTAVAISPPFVTETGSPGNPGSIPDKSPYVQGLQPTDDPH